PPTLLQPASDDANSAPKAKDARDMKYLMRQGEVKELDQLMRPDERLAQELKRRLAGGDQVQLNRLMQLKEDSKDRDKTPPDDLGVLTIKGADESLVRQLEALLAAEKRKPQATRILVRPDALLYQRPAFAPDGRLFTDLVAFAPALSTTQA